MESLFSMTTVMITDLPLSSLNIRGILVAGFIITFVLSFSLGANHVANSIGASVGSKVLTVGQAMILASFFKGLGAVLLGTRDAETMHSGIFDIEMYEDKEDTFVCLEISALSTSALWFFLATAVKMPVSTTHSIVGASLGAHLVVFGVKGVKWLEIGMLAISWIVSPVLSGVCSAVIFTILKYILAKQDDTLEYGLRSLPVWYGLVIFINFFSIIYDGPEVMGFNNIPLWGLFAISVGCGLIASTFTWFLLVPHLRRKITGPDVEGPKNIIDEKRRILCKKVQYFRCENQKEKVNLVGDAHEMATVDARKKTSEGREINCEMVGLNETKEEKPEEGSDQQGSASEPIDGEDKHSRNISIVCSPLQVLTSVFASLAQGGNDVSNSVVPFMAIWLVFKTGEISANTGIPLWVLFYGAIGNCVGLCTMGRRVLKTVSEDITTMNPASGFSADLGAAVTLLLACKLGIPISSTTCIIASIASVGMVQSRENVNWSLFASLTLATIVTLPANVGLSAAIMSLAQLVW